MNGNSRTINIWYGSSILLSIAAFSLPSTRIIIAGETYNQWFISTNGGKVVFINLLVFGALLQAFAFIKAGKFFPWVGLVTGLYIAFYAGNQLWKCLIRFNAHRSSTLVDKLHPVCTPLAGVWLLLASGILLFTIAAIKIIYRSLSAKKPGASHDEARGT